MSETQTLDVQSTAQQLLLQAKTGKPTEGFVQQLAKISPEELAAALTADAEKLAFWINVYNAFTILLLEKDPDQITTWSGRKRYFGSPKIWIAGEHLSFNDIEHGILRRSMVWWSLGYLKKWGVGAFEAKMRVERLDPRLHFALNCGMVSCPPIRFYETENIDALLDLASAAYLETEVNYDQANNTLVVSKLMQGYMGDFGGTKGVLEFISKYKELPKAPFDVKYGTYDWTAAVGVFAEN